MSPENERRYKEWLAAGKPPDYGDEEEDEDELSLPEPSRPGTPTTSMPGSPSKIEEMARRFACGEPVLHDDDRKMGERDGYRAETRGSVPFRTQVVVETHAEPEVVEEIQLPAPRPRHASERKPSTNEFLHKERERKRRASKGKVAAEKGWAMDERGQLYLFDEVVPDHRKWHLVRPVRGWRRRRVKHGSLSRLLCDEWVLAQAA